MKRLLIQKLRSTEGFMLAEQLVSMIFIGLLCVAVSVGLGVALGVFNNITQEAQVQQLLSRASQQVSDELTFSLSVAGPGHDPSFVSAATQTEVQLVNAPDSKGIALQGKGISSGTSSEEETVVLVPSVKGLIPVIKELQYQDNTWTFILQVTRDGKTAAETPMTVARVGN